VRVGLPVLLAAACAAGCAATARGQERTDINDLRRARRLANDAWSRAQATVGRREQELADLQERHGAQTRVVSAIQAEEPAWYAEWFHRRRLDQAKGALRRISDELDEAEEALTDARNDEIVRRLELIRALRPLVERLFELADRARVAQRRRQMQQRLAEAGRELGFLDDLERQRLPPSPPPDLDPLEEELRRPRHELARRVDLYRRQVEGHRDKAAKIQPDVTALTARLRHLDRLARQGFAIPNLETLRENARARLEELEALQASFEAAAEDYDARAERLAREVAAPPPREHPR